MLSAMFFSLPKRQGNTPPTPVLPAISAVIRSSSTMANGIKITK
jgi:hypothetical protein